MAKLVLTNLRVNIEESTHQIYKDLADKGIDKAEDVPFSKMPDLFLAAACLGVKEGLYKELKIKRDIFVADAFDHKVQLPILIALAAKKDDFESIDDPRRILSICECWANGGIQILYDELMIGQGLRPLYRLVDLINKNE